MHFILFRYDFSFLRCSNSNICIITWKKRTIFKLIHLENEKRYWNEPKCILNLKVDTFVWYKRNLKIKFSSIVQYHENLQNRKIFIPFWCHFSQNWCYSQIWITNSYSAGKLHKKNLFILVFQNDVEQWLLTSNSNFSNLQLVSWKLEQRLIFYWYISALQN